MTNFFDPRSIKTNLLSAIMFVLFIFGFIRNITILIATNQQQQHQKEQEKNSKNIKINNINNSNISNCNIKNYCSLSINNIRRNSNSISYNNNIS